MSDKIPAIKATYANRFYIEVRGKPEYMAKFTFGEVSSDGDVFHTSVVMSLDNARALYAHLGSRLNTQDKNVTEAANIKPFTPSGKPT